MHRTLPVAGSLCGLGVLFAPAGGARAQHADIAPRVSGGRIVADAFDDATGTPTPDARVFGYDFREDPADPYFAGDPGFNAAAGSGLPGGSQLGFNLLGSSSGAPSNLSYWSGAGPVSFGPAPSGETLRLNLGAQDRTAGAGTGEIAGFNIGTVAADGSVHRHLNSFLQGSDGNSEPADGNVPADGIYLVPIELTSSDGGVADSAPLFLVFNNGLTEDQHDQAIDFVQATFVPEPTAAGAAAAVGGSLLLRRRRKRQRA